MKRGEKIVGHVSIELSSRVLVIFETQSTLYRWGEKREARKPGNNVLLKEYKVASMPSAVRLRGTRTALVNNTQLYEDCSIAVWGDSKFRCCLLVCQCWHPARSF